MFSHFSLVITEMLISYYLVNVLFITFIIKKIKFIHFHWEILPPKVLYENIVDFLFCFHQISW